MSSISGCAAALHELVEDVFEVDVVPLGYDLPAQDRATLSVICARALWSLAGRIAIAASCFDRWQAQADQSICQPDADANGAILISQVQPILARRIPWTITSNPLRNKERCYTVISKDFTDMDRPKGSTRWQVSAMHPNQAT